jgi:hypothetical protein
MVMEFEGHFQVKAHKFGQMSVGVTVFGTKNGTNCEYTVKVAGNGHLFVQLWRLGQIG